MIQLICLIFGHNWYPFTPWHSACDRCGRIQQTNRFIC